MNKLCITLRPGTLIGYQGKVWKVTSNSTLDQRFEVRTLAKPYQTKSFRYRAGQEIDVRWVPDARQ